MNSVRIYMSDGTQVVMNCHGSLTPVGVIADIVDAKIEGFVYRHITDDGKTSIINPDHVMRMMEE